MKEQIYKTGDEVYFYGEGMSEYKILEVNKNSFKVKNLRFNLYESEYKPKDQIKTKEQA